MLEIGFIGLGNMGLPMAKNLVAAGHSVTGFDRVETALAELVAAGGQSASDIAGAVARAEIVVTMLPAGRHVEEVYLGTEGILGALQEGSLLIDSSTIDVATARASVMPPRKKALRWSTRPSPAELVGQPLAH